MDAYIQDLEEALAYFVLLIDRGNLRTEHFDDPDQYQLVDGVVCRARLLLKQAGSLTEKPDVFVCSGSEKLLRG